MSIRVMIIEDMPETRDALRAALGACGLEVVGAFGSGEEALAHVAAVQAEVALVDLGLPGISGIETIRRLRALAPAARILVLTVLETADAILQAIAAGASGYLLKSAPCSEICAATRQVRDGLTPISPLIAHHLLDALRAPSPNPEACHYDLTTRETEVLGLLVRGHSYSSVATGLGVGLGTIQGYVKNIYRKLEVASKAEATYLAVAHKLVPLE